MPLDEPPVPDGWTPVSAAPPPVPDSWTPVPQDKGFFNAIGSGFRDAAKEGKQSAQAMMGNAPTPQPPPEETSMAQQPRDWHDVMHPKILAEKMLYGLAKSSPMLASSIMGGVAGGAAGSQIPVVGTTLGAAGGAAIGAGVAGWAQALGPYVAQEIQKTPDDMDGAFERAKKQAVLAGVIDGTSMGLFELKPFTWLLKNEISGMLASGAGNATAAATAKQFAGAGAKDLATQALAIQPAAAVAGQYAQDASQGKQMTADEALSAAVGGFADTMLPMAAHKGIDLTNRAIRGTPVAAPPSQLPPDLNAPLEPHYDLNTKTFATKDADGRIIQTGFQNAQDATQQATAYNDWAAVNRTRAAADLPVDSNVPPPAGVTPPAPPTTGNALPTMGDITKEIPNPTAEAAVPGQTPPEEQGPRQTNQEVLDTVSGKLRRSFAGMRADQAAQGEGSGPAIAVTPQGEAIAQPLDAGAQAAYDRMQAERNAPPPVPTPPVAPPDTPTIHVTADGVAIPGNMDPGTQVALDRYRNQQATGTVPQSVKEPTPAEHVANAVQAQTGPFQYKDIYQATRDAGVKPGDVRDSLAQMVADGTLTRGKDNKYTQVKPKDHEPPAAPPPEAPTPPAPLAPEHIAAINDSFDAALTNPTPANVAAHEQAVATPPTPPEPGSRETPVQVQDASHVREAEAAVSPDPTDAQKEAGNYAKGHMNVQGIPVSIETPKGALRTGTDPKGNPWSVKLPAAYGYIKRTLGADGDHVDTYVGDHPDSTRAYVVDQYDPKTGTFDEHKAILGARSIKEAQRIYDKGFSDSSGPTRRGAITEMSTDEFKDWLNAGETKKPLNGNPTLMDNTVHAGSAEHLRNAARQAGIAPNRMEIQGDRANSTLILRRQTFKEAEAIRNAVAKQRQTAFNRAQAARKRSKGPQSLIEWIAANGGIKPDGELKAMDADKHFAPGYGKFVRANGKHADYVREAAVEARYHLPEGGAELNHLYEAIRQDMAAQKAKNRNGRLYAEQDRGDVADREAQRQAEEAAAQVNAFRDEIEHLNDTKGYALLPGEKARALELMQQGHDASDAVDMAMEEGAIYGEHDFASHADEHEEDPHGDIPFDEPIAPEVDRSAEQPRDQPEVSEPGAEAGSAAAGEEPARGADEPAVKDHDLRDKSVGEAIGAAAETPEQIEARKNAKAQEEERLRGAQTRMGRTGQQSVESQPGGLFEDRNDLFNQQRQPAAAPAKNAELPENKYQYATHLTALGEIEANKVTVDALNGKITEQDAVKRLANLRASDAISEGVARVNLSRLDDWNEGSWKQAVDDAKHLFRQISDNPSTLGENDDRTKLLNAAYGDRQDVHQAARDYLTEAGKDGNEHLVAVDAKTGKVIEATTSGAKGVVDHSAEVKRRMDDPKETIIAHHNHTNGTAPSAEDVGMLHLNGLQAVVVHTPDNAFTIRLSDQIDPKANVDATRLENLWWHAFNNISGVVDHLIDNGHISKDQAWLYKTDLTNRALAAAGVLKYDSSFKLPSNGLRANMVNIIRHGANAARHLGESYEFFPKGKEITDVHQHATARGIDQNLRGLSDGTQSLRPVGRERQASDKTGSTVAGGGQHQKNNQGYHQINEDVAPPFYSALTRAIEDSKQAKAHGSQWAGMIDRMPGIKKEEIQWSGIKDFLDREPGMITRDQLLDELRDREVNLQEVQKTYGPKPSGADDQAVMDWAKQQPRLDPESIDRLLTAIRQGSLWAVEDLEDIGVPDDLLEPYLRYAISGYGAKYGEYKLPGGKNYREMLLTLPDVDPWYNSRHWDEPNVVAHVRFDDRKGPNGEKLLHVAEIQSDWHQQGRDRGYEGNSDTPNGAAGTKNMRVPDAPLKKTWHEMAFRRMVRYAAEHGYDGLSWDTGQTNADRYGMSRLIQSLQYKPSEGTMRWFYHDGSYGGADNVKREDLPRYIGQELTDKLLAAEPNEHGVHSLLGRDMLIGGEGMKGFYDKILPDYARKFGRPFGAQVGETMVDGGESSYPAHYIPITDTMRETANQVGFPLFKLGQGVSPHTPEAAKAAVEQAWKEMGLSPNNLITRDSLTTDEHGNVSGATWGRVAAVALDAADPRSTAFHEGFHVMEAAGAVTPREIAAMSRETEAQRALIAKHMPGINADTLTPDEVRAYGFELYQRGIDRYSDMPQVFRDVYRRVGDFINRVANYLHGAGFTTSSDIYKAVGTGERGGRVPSAATDRATMINRLDQSANQIGKDWGSKFQQAVANVHNPDEARKVPKTLYEVGQRLAARGANYLPQAVRDWGKDMGRALIMQVNPMATGEKVAQAFATNFANMRRANIEERNSNMRALMDKFGRSNPVYEQMWSAIDNANLRANELVDKGLDVDSAKAQAKKEFFDTLPADQKAIVQGLNTFADSLWQWGKAEGLIKGDGQLFWTPHTISFLDPEGRLYEREGEGGNGLSTTAGSLMHRKYATAEEAAAAAGDDAVAVKDIRLMVDALYRVQNALAGRKLINDIKESGSALGFEPVSKVKKDGYFRVDHPAFTTMVPRTEEREVTQALMDKRGLSVSDGQVLDRNGEPLSSYKVDGNGNVSQVVWAKDERGNPIYDKSDLWVSKAYEGPLRAILTEKPGAWYTFARALQNQSMGMIMMSPFIHLQVVAGKAAAKNPLKGIGSVLRMGYAAQGKQIADTPELKRFAIENGLVPPAQQYMSENLLDTIMHPEDYKGGSWSAKLMGALFDRVSPEVGDKARAAVDKAGEFWHHTLLWDQVRNIQLGIWDDARKDFEAKGMDSVSAARMAAHTANRLVGAIPAEAMSDGLRKTMNLLMFSRSFTFTNLALFKDSLVGLPGNIRAQIENDFQAGTMSANQIAAARAQYGAKGGNLVAKAAFSALLLDLGLNHVVNAMTQSAVDSMVMNKTDDEIQDGYEKRLQALLNRAQEHPAAAMTGAVLGGLGGAAVGGVKGGMMGALAGSAMTGGAFDLDPTMWHEPGKNSRILIGYEPNGRADYLRLPVGKVGEDLLNWMTSPIATAKSKMSSLAKPMMEVFTNQDAFGNPVYDQAAIGMEGAARNAGSIVKHIMEGALPIDWARGAVHTATGNATDTDYWKTLGNLTGFTYSRGAPGGPEQGAIMATRREVLSNQKLNSKQIRDLIQHGDIDEAKEAMTTLRMTPAQQRNLIKAALGAPNTKSTRQSDRWFQKYATPEERERNQLLDK